MLSRNTLIDALSPLLVGCGAASFWRGAWYILDDNLFPNNPLHSCMSSLGLGVLSTLVFQPIVVPKTDPTSNESRTNSYPYRKTRWYSHPVLSPQNIVKFKTLAGIYGLAWSCVLLWRGTWMGWDLIYEHVTDSKTKSVDEEEQESTSNRTISGLASHLTAVAFLSSFGILSSIFAPPARIAVIRDIRFKVGRWNS